MDIRRLMRGALFGLLVLAAATAHAGDEAALDPTFGTGGTVQTSINLSGISRIASQADGKILVAGFAYVDGAEPVVARYDVDGTIDTTFGFGGTVAFDYQGAGGWGVRAVEQSDGKIVVAGFASGGDVGVARFNADGTPDLGFGAGGSVSTSVGGSFLNANTDDMLIDAAGNIVVLATSSTGGSSQFIVAVLRFLPGGGLDPTFGAGGVIHLSYAPFTFGSGITEQADGKLVVVGSKSGSLSTPQQAFVTRLDGAGAPDATFGSAGSAFLSFSIYNDVVQQPDGKLVVAGGAGFLAARYETDGDLDPTFGTGGVVVSSFLPTFEMGNGLVLQPDGKIVVAGTSDNTGGGAFRVVRYTSAGALDPTFGVGGTTTVQVTAGDDFGYEVLRRPDGKLVIGGAIDSSQQIGLAQLGTGCLSSPVLGCKQGTRPGASGFKVKGGGRPSLKFKWARGSATTLPELGSPTSTTSYQLCAYDLSPTGARTLVLDAPAGGTCGNGPCWTGTPFGFRYKSRTGTPEGLTAIKLATGTDGRARAQAKAKGTSFVPPTLPLAVPLRVQLVGSNGTCFEADFSAIGVRRNDLTSFSAKSD